MSVRRFLHIDTCEGDKSVLKKIYNTIARDLSFIFTKADSNKFHWCPFTFQCAKGKYLEKFRKYFRLMRNKDILRIVRGFSQKYYGNHIKEIWKGVGDWKRNWIRPQQISILSIQFLSLLKFLGLKIVKNSFRRNILTKFISVQ